MTRSPSVSPDWRTKRGLVAAVMGALLLEAATAGGSRDCMPSFYLNILAGQAILFTVFGAPAIAIVGISAFIAAAIPSLISTPFRLATAGVVIAIAAVILATHVGELLALPLGGVLVGLCVRATERYSRWWFPVTIVLELCIASAIFAFGHYGRNNCYP